MADRPILFAELTRLQLRELVPDALVVVPVGSTEQHGPHLPTGTDFMHAEWVARAAAERVASDLPVVVTPTLPFGSAEHHMPFGGTITIPTTTYYDVLVAILDSLVRDGFRRLFVVNGHGGNHELIQLAARDMALRHPVSVAAASWWLAAWDVLVAEGAHEVGRLPGHAGVFETSLVMAMRPELVAAELPHRDAPGSTDPRRWPGLHREERHGSWVAIDGYGDSPDLADEQKGRRWLEVSADELARLLRAFYAGPVTMDPAGEANRGG